MGLFGALFDVVTAPVKITCAVADEVIETTAKIANDVVEEIEEIFED